MFGYDYDSDEYGYELRYGMNATRGNPHDDYEYYMYMQGMLDDSYDSYNSYDYQGSPGSPGSLDSQNSQKSWRSEYFDWEETRMKDSHLLHFSALVPQLGERMLMREEGARITSMAGGEWSMIAKMENEGGWLESNGVIGYQDMYNLAGNLVNLLTAWRMRMKHCQVEWSKDQITKLLNVWKVTRSDEVVEFGDEGPEDYNTGFVWWMFQMMGTKETDLSVDDRLGYSVGRGMMVFGTEESFDQLVKEVIGVKNLLRGFVIGVLSENLPVPLPYPTLLSLSKIILSSGGATNLGWSSSGRASQLVESRYVNRLYLAILDIYNIIREVMFKHAAESASPSFPTKFAFMRSTLARNMSLLQSFHQLSKHEEPQSGSIFCQGLKELQFKFKSSRRTDVVLHDINSRNRMAVSEGHVFFVLTCKRGGDGLNVAVSDLETGELVKEFIAISISQLSGNQYTLSTPVCVKGDYMVISLSQGYHKIPSVSSHDLVFVINWVHEKLVMSKRVPHSSQFKSAVSEMSDLYYTNRDSGDNDSLNSSFDDEEIIGVNSSLGVFLTEKSGSVFLLHKEIVMPKTGMKADLNKWGQYVRIWRLQEEDSMVQELHDVRVLDLHAGLVIYEEADDGRSNHNKKGSFTKFNDIDVKVKWLDLESGREVFQENFMDTLQTPQAVYSIVSLPESGTVVAQHHPGQDSVDIYNVSEAGLVGTSQKIVFPALRSVGFRRADDLKIRLITKDLLSFSHSVTSPSLRNSFPAKGARCVLARAGSVNEVGEMFVPHTMASEAISRLAATNVYYLVNPADMILQEGTSLVLMREENENWESEITVTLQQYKFQKPALEVIKSDDNIAKEIVQNKGAVSGRAVRSNLLEDLSDLADSDLSSYESGSDDEELSSITSERTCKRPSDQSPVDEGLLTAPTISNDVELATRSPGVEATTTIEERRMKGRLVKWCGSFGFLKLDDRPDASNVFIHINEIRKPRPLLTAGTRLEVKLVKDMERDMVKGVAGRVLD